MADPVIISSGSESDENRDKVSDAEKDDTGSSVAVESRPVFDMNSGSVDVAKFDSGGGAYTLPVNIYDVFGFDDEFEGNGEDVGTCAKLEERVISSSEADGEKQGILSEKKVEIPNEQFLVGDFVWGKIKSHPWWPGQIYDSKDASAFAVKHGQVDRILVAYFGDGSCSWCLPSQLVPFFENFKQMSAETSSKSLDNAIQCALDDIGRLVEESMTCKCVKSDRRDGLARPLVSNAGVKSGVLVPDVDVSRLAVPEYCSNGILDILTDYAKGVSVDCLLELAILKSSISAFYRARGGRYQLPMYCEPVYIEGLEDMKKPESEKENEISLLGPSEDDWLSSSPAAVTNFGDKIYQRRKQRSVFELMAEDDDSGMPRSLKRDKEVKEEKGISSGKRRKGSENGDKGLVSSDGNTSLKRMVEVDVAEKSSDEANDKAEVLSSPRERKRSKYLSPPYTNPGWSFGNYGSDKSWTMTEHSTSLTSHTKVSDISSAEELTFSATDVDVNVDELLSEVQFAAADHLYLGKKGSLETVWGFVSALRSSSFTNGVNYKLYQTSKTGGNKRILPRNQESDAFAPEKSKSDNDGKTPKSGLRKKTTGGKKPNSKKSKMAEGEVSTSLILTFTPEFPLPSKEEIMDLFGQFGCLNEKETSVMTESRSVRIVYVKESDAEEAFKSSVTESPFGAKNVNYWLQRPSTNSKPSHDFVKNPGLSDETGDEFMSDVLVFRQKLDVMIAVLGNCHSKFSAEEKSSLEEEMKKLMSNMEAVSEMVRATAEKCS